MGLNVRWPWVLGSFADGLFVGQTPGWGESVEFGEVDDY